MIGWVSAVFEPVTMKTIAMNDFGGGVAHRRRAERHLQRDHRPGMTQTGAVIDVIAAEQSAVHLLQKVVVFVGRLGAAVHRHGVGAVALVNFDQPVGAIFERFIPGDFAPVIAIEGLCARARRLRRLAQQRRGYPIFVVNEVVAEAAFDAEITVVDHGVEG